MNTIKQCSCGSFTIEAWLRWNDTVALDKLPVLCTDDSALCLYVEDAHVVGQLGEQTAVGGTTLVHDQWTHVMLRYDVAG